MNDLRIETCDYGHKYGQVFVEGVWESQHCVTCLLAKIERLERECKQAEASDEAAHQKFEVLLDTKNWSHSRETCGCSYDNPDDVCMVHSPQLVKAKKKIEQLERWKMGALDLMQHQGARVVDLSQEVRKLQKEK
jgi:hypothetical protein